MRSIIAFTVAAMSLVVGAMFFFYRDGGTLVAAQDDTVGEMLLDEGLRLEAGDYWHSAKEKYSQAETARFQGEKNMRHLHLKLVDRRDYSLSALQHYRLATTGYELAKVKPSLWRQAWAGRCDLLVMYRQWDELEKAVEEWTNAVKAAGPRGIYQTSVDQNLDHFDRTRFQAILAGHDGKIEETEQLLRLSWNDDAAVLWGQPISFRELKFIINVN